MKFELKYKLDALGWADIIISNGNETFESQVSYLNDSIRELGKMAIELASGERTANVVFMDEPGELHLFVQQENDLASFEARWFEDWVGWGFSPEDEYEVKISGKCNTKEIIQQIKSNFKNIYENIGPIEYKKRWVEHEFPMNTFIKLEEL